MVFACGACAGAEAAGAVGRSAARAARREPAGGTAEGDIHRGSATHSARMGRAGPVERIVSLANLVGDGGAGENRVNGGRMSRVGRARVVHEALQLLHVGQAPVGVAQVFLRVLLLHPGQRVLPIHALAAVGLGPGQAGRAVGDGAIAVVVEVVAAVAGVSADADGEELELAPARPLQVVAFDAAIGEVDAEDFACAADGLADVPGAGRPLGINDARANARVAVGELEEVGVNERPGAGNLRAGRSAGVEAAGVEEGIQFFDGREAPVGEAGESGGVEFCRQRLDLGSGQLVAPGGHFIVHDVRAALPGQAGDIVANGQAIGAQAVAGRVPRELGVLAVERLAGLGWGDLASVVVALRLSRIHDGVGQGGAEVDTAEPDRGQDEQDCPALRL